MLALTPADVACLPSGHVVLALHSTKTGRGQVQSVSLFDPLLMGCCQCLWCGSPRKLSALLLPTPRGASFKKVLEFLLVPPSTFSLYSLRRGGATYHWQRTRNFEFTMLMGRWQEQRTCRIYLDEARALLIPFEASAASNSRIRSFAGLFDARVRAAGEAPAS